LGAAERSRDMRPVRAIGFAMHHRRQRPRSDDRSAIPETVRQEREDIFAASRRYSGAGEQLAKRQTPRPVQNAGRRFANPRDLIGCELRVFGDSPQHPNGSPSDFAVELCHRGNRCIGEPRIAPINGVPLLQLGHA